MQRLRVVKTKQRRAKKSGEHLVREVFATAGRIDIVPDAHVHTQPVSVTPATPRVSHTTTNASMSLAQPQPREEIQNDITCNDARDGCRNQREDPTLTGKALKGGMCTVRKGVTGFRAARSFVLLEEVRDATRPLKRRTQRRVCPHT
jgi:hypothetical protein